MANDVIVFYQLYKVVNPFRFKQEFRVFETLSTLTFND